MTLAREGAEIVFCDIASDVDEVDYPLARAADVESTVRAVESLGRRCIALTADVRDLEAVQQVVDAAVAQCGHVDVVVAIASMSAARWQTMIDVNLTGVFNTFRAALPHMIARGPGRLVATTRSPTTASSSTQCCPPG